MTDIHIDETELTRLKAKLTNLRCPKCNQFLLSTPTEGGVILWCARQMTVCPNIGANEGAFGRTDKAAHEILVSKLSYSSKKKE